MLACMNTSDKGHHHNHLSDTLCQRTLNTPGAKLADNNTRPVCKPVRRRPSYDVDDCGGQASQINIYIALQSPPALDDIHCSTHSLTSLSWHSLAASIHA